MGIERSEGLNGKHAARGEGGRDVEGTQQTICASADQSVGGAGGRPVGRSVGKFEDRKQLDD